MLNYYIDVILTLGVKFITNQILILIWTKNFNVKYTQFCNFKISWFGNFFKCSFFLQVNVTYTMDA